MSLVHEKIKLRENAYTPPPLPPKDSNGVQPNLTALAKAMSEAITKAMAAMPAPVVHVDAPVVNVPKPEVKITSPVYVTVPEIKVPATTVNVPDGKAPVVNIEPAAVTLQTNRPKKWKFSVSKRDEYQRIVEWTAEAMGE